MSRNKVALLEMLWNDSIPLTEPELRPLIRIAFRLMAATSGFSLPVLFAATAARREAGDDGSVGYLNAEAMMQLFGVTRPTAVRYLRQGGAFEFAGRRLLRHDPDLRERLAEGQLAGCLTQADAAAAIAAGTNITLLYQAARAVGAQPLIRGRRRMWKQADVERMKCWLADYRKNPENINRRERIFGTMERRRQLCRNRLDELRLADVVRIGLGVAVPDAGLPRAPRLLAEFTTVAGALADYYNRFASGLVGNDQPYSPEVYADAVTLWAAGKGYPVAYGAATGWLLVRTDGEPWLNLDARAVEAAAAGARVQPWPTP